MLYRPYWQQKIKEADNDLQAYTVERRLLLRDKYITGLEIELEKWETWKPDDETLAALQEQARARDGSYTNGLAAQSCYIGGLEGHVRALDATNAALRAQVAALEAECEAAEELIRYCDIPKHAKPELTAYQQARAARQQAEGTA